MNISLDTTPPTKFGPKEHLCRIGDHTITAATRSELQAKVSDAIDKAFTQPKLGFAKAGNKITIVMEHMGVVTTHVADVTEDGVRPLTETAACFGTTCEEQTKCSALDMFKQLPLTWMQRNLGEIPDGMPASKIADWKQHCEDMRGTK